MSGLVLAIIIAAVVVLVGIASTVRRSSRRRALRNRFGPEYDHTVENADSRKAAEHDLRERASQRDELNIREITPGAAARFLQQWQLVQQEFVDAPIPAVQDAQELVTRVMNERGYPTPTAETRELMLSVDHADVMDNYRAATEIEGRSTAGNATTEELRQAMQHYRAIFDRLLGDAPTASDSAYPSNERSADVSSGDVTVMRGTQAGPGA